MRKQLAYNIVMDANDSIMTSTCMTSTLYAGQMLAANASPGPGSKIAPGSAAARAPRRPGRGGPSQLGCSGPLQQQQLLGCCTFALVAMLNLAITTFYAPPLTG